MPSYVGGWSERINAATALAIVSLLLLAGCNGNFGTATPDQAAGSDSETSILEEGGNINLALREAQNGMGPSIVGDPTAVYGRIMTYKDAVKAAGSKVIEGESQAWKFDRPVYLYLFEGEIFDPDPRTRNTTDWAQKVVILDAETGSPFMEITHRAPAKLDVSWFLPLTIRDNSKGVPPREIKSLNRPPPIAAPAATPAPREPDKPSTATPSPKLPGEITPRPAPEHLRLGLGDGVVAAFVEGLSLEFSGKVAYVTHVASGSQVVLDRQGQVIERHDGRDDGPARLEAVLADEAAMKRIMASLRSDEDTRPQESIADWAHSVTFGGITYRAKGSLVGPATIEGERLVTVDDLGLEFYRVAFRRVGYVGPYFSQDGDATYLNPGTPVYTVKGYTPEFRLATFSDGRVTLFEADSNPAAKVGADLLDIRDRVRSIGINSTQSGCPELASIGDPGLVEEMINAALLAPVDQGRRDHEGDWYYIAFRMKDGTAVVRHFWPESGELSRGIITPESFRVSVLQALVEASALPR